MGPVSHGVSSASRRTEKSPVIHARDRKLHATCQNRSLMGRRQNGRGGL